MARSESGRFRFSGSIAESMGGIGESSRKFAGEFDGSEPFCIRRGFAPSENQNKIFLRRKDKEHSAPSRWSGSSRAPSQGD